MNLTVKNAVQFCDGARRTTRRKRVVLQVDPTGEVEHVLKELLAICIILARTCYF
jgi:hypothetical protein